ncbi:MAG: ATP-dependent Clp protease ATP-binding subunit ClpC [Parcubacteria group bacterium Athens1014_10]|nr:MAG: ATP-dependent Clp protease ATP-binding subunit ClpC [Parcubacteria group bacterium Athens1014_10]
MARSDTQFIICPECSGQGEKNNKKCPACHGVGVYSCLGGYFLFFKKHFNLDDFLKIKIKKVFKKIIIFWFSLLGDMYLFYRLEQDIREQQRKINHFLTTSPYSELADFSRISKLKSKFKIEISDSFSKKTDDVFWRSWALARKLKHARVTPLHLFASLLLYPKVKELFARLEVDLYLLKSKVRYLLSLIEQKEIIPEISLDLKKIILKAYFVAYNQNNPCLDFMGLLTALAEEESIVKEIFYDLEIDSEKIKNVFAWIGFDEELIKREKKFRINAFFKPKGVMNRSFTAVATPFLDQYSQDLTISAKSGSFSLCVGREKEIKQIFQSLESGKNGFVLVGEPGVGKKSIIEGIAQLMVEEEVPEILKDKRLISLDIGSLAGGESTTIETKLKAIINEVARAGNIILFIEDISNIVGVKSRSGELDVADIIYSYLNNKYLILFSTCSAADYQRVLKNSALGNFLEKNVIEEPKKNQAIQILESKVGALEARHQIYFSYKAIEQIVELTSRYLPDQNLPEKGISLLEEASVYVNQAKGKNSLIKEEDAAYLVSRKTKIPLTKITEKESEKLLNLEKRIHQRIIGQEEAVIAVSAALRRARTELRELKRPIANLLFLGPTGVGKTELAKAIGEIYFGSEKNMIRLDMSEYQEKSSIDRMLGAPISYRGSEMGGYLTEAVKKQPFSLLLLDEIEKAHPDILNLFLQVMEDGRLTDSSGKTVDFTNIILIGTSNACSNFIQEEIRNNKDIIEIKKDLLNQELKSYFLPEFLNRFDEIIVFKPLIKEEIKQIAHLLLIKLQKQLDKKGISLRATDEAIEELVELGYDPIFGARPLKRVIQDRVNNSLADYLLKGELKRRDIAVLEKGGEIRVVKGKEL